jgi:hypothetical protein
MRSCGLLSLLVLAPAALAQTPGFNPVGGGEFQHREVRTALEAYYLDTNAYPPWTTYAYRDQQVPTFASAALTTPIAYLRAMPVDIFSYDERHWTAYCAAQIEGRWAWAIWSAGPDGDYDFPAQSALGPSSASSEAAARVYQYDETNGVISDGDLITTGP